MATTKATTLAHTLGGISSDISTAEINRLDGVTGDIQTLLNLKAPIASPTFTGTITAPNDSISGDAVSGGTIGSGTFNGTIGTATFPAGHVIQYKTVLNTTASSTMSSDDGGAFGTGLTITSPQSGSKIIAWAIGGYAFTIGNGTSYNTRCGISFYQDSTTNFYFTGASEAHSSPGGSHLHVPGSAIAEYTSASTSDIDITCRAGRHSSKSGKWYASATIPIRIIAMEVKQ